MNASRIESGYERTTVLLAVWKLQKCAAQPACCNPPSGRAYFEFHTACITWVHVAAVFFFFVLPRPYEIRVCTIEDVNGGQTACVAYTRKRRKKKNKILSFSHELVQRVFTVHVQALHFIYGLAAALLHQSNSVFVQSLSLDNTFHAF